MMSNYRTGRAAVILAVIMGNLLLLVIITVTVMSLKNNGTANSSKFKTDTEKLDEFLDKVKRKYYELYPAYMYLNPDVNFIRDIHKYHVYNAHPMAIKKRTDESIKLLKALKELKLDKHRLKQRQLKGLAQLEHFIGSYFGHPYDENYYAGDWMMGPNYFCKQPICMIGNSISGVFNLNSFAPTKLNDVEIIINILKNVKSNIEQYQSNLWLGVKTGMVASQPSCRAGLYKLKSKYSKIDYHGKEGVLKEYFTGFLLHEIYYKHLDNKSKIEFVKKYNISITQKISQVLIDYVGLPFHNLIEYLSTNHSRYCVPTNISSGLANLPLNNVWFDQKETSVETTRILPTGELLNGKKSYGMILPYYTTSTEYTPDKVYDIGMQRRDFYYQRAIKLAKEITNISDEKTAIKNFTSYLNSDVMFFNTTTIPDNESGETGGKRCRNMAIAKKNCPIRYTAMQQWFQTVQKTLAKIDQKISHLFFTNGSMATRPTCSIQLKGNFNPTSASQSYRRAGKSCRAPSSYLLPFFLDRPGPMYYVYTVAGHEGRPGHHTQIQGFLEHFSTNDKNDIYSWLNLLSKYTAFVEGWALYAENPLLSTKTDLYQDEPLQEYGMIKSQLWRVLRLIIDTGLHTRGMKMHEAKEMFTHYTWDTTDRLEKETTRYMSGPGQATAYMIGQIAIWNMHNKTKEAFIKSNITFDEKEFHYHIISQGSSAPLPYLESYIDLYIKCKINPTSERGCHDILNPNTDDEVKKEIGTKERWEIIKYHYSNDYSHQ